MYFVIMLLGLDLHVVIQMTNNLPFSEELHLMCCCDLDSSLCLSESTAPKQYAQQRYFKQDSSTSGRERYRRRML